MTMRFKKLFPAIISMALLAGCSSQKIVAGDQGNVNPPATETTTTSSVPQSQPSSDGVIFKDAGGSGQASSTSSTVK